MKHWNAHYCASLQVSWPHQLLWAHAENRQCKLDEAKCTMCSVQQKFTSEHNVFSPSLAMRLAHVPRGTALRVSTNGHAPSANIMPLLLVTTEQLQDKGERPLPFRDRRLEEATG